MTFSRDDPLFMLSQMIDVTFSNDHEEYDDYDHAIRRFVSDASDRVLHDLRSDIPYLRAQFPDPDDRLAWFGIDLPFADGVELDAVLTELDRASEAALRDRDSMGDQHSSGAADP